MGAKSLHVYCEERIGLHMHLLCGGATHAVKVFLLLFLSRVND